MFKPNISASICGPFPTFFHFYLEMGKLQHPGDTEQKLVVEINK